MRIIHIGDIIGRPGRKAIQAHLPKIREHYKPDVIVANVENSAHGFGVTPSIAKEMFRAGIHCLTTGNHIWDQQEIVEFVDEEPRLLRPINFPTATPGFGVYQGETKGGKRYAVVNAMARLFMDPLDCPFAKINVVLRDYQLGNHVDAVIVDFHGEASSEKMSFGHHVDGRVSMVVGTHTHVPTADAQILNGGTAYQTDTGMVGSFDSVIGMQKEGAVARFTSKMRGPRLEPATEHVTLCAVFVETDDATGLATHIEPIRVGGRLIQTL